MKGIKKTLKRKQPIKDDYKIIISELGANPFRMIRIAFALMGVIPLLIFFYIIIGKNFLYRLFLGSNGFIIGVSVFISMFGFLVAYTLVINMVVKLLSYSSERKRADEAKTELLLAVTHDLKTPLTVIKTGIQNILDGITGAINKAQAEIVRACLNAVNKTTDFINELLDVSKITFIRMNFKREFFDFGKIVKDEVNGISELIKKNDLHLSSKVPTQDAKLWGDKEKLSRAVMNLLSNAVKYTPGGGRIDLALSSDDDTVKFAVANTGSGIPPDKIDKIFDKYERFTPDAKVEGVGLGLHIVKDIVDLHKGHLAAKSTPGQETEFSIVLPRDLRAGGPRAQGRVRRGVRKVQSGLGKIRSRLRRGGS